ncbi:unnamed protein product [Peronospora destructor]|uniref:fructose-bisphosphatase n=1 Tax=Peronospora destructor TaxID=86335 RepID=A0AAV0V3G6_9STRA|nr:unnamed protein product [Peronospora destructor]
MSAQVDHSNPITLSRFILAEKEIQGNADLSVLFTSIELACKVIASSVRRAGLTGLYGLDGSENATGDQVKKLDVLSNDIFINSLKFSTKIEVMVSEEEEEPILVEHASGGTSNALRLIRSTAPLTLTATCPRVLSLQSTNVTPRWRRVRTRIFYSLAANSYQRDTACTELHAARADDIRIPDKPKAIYSCNEGNYAHWDRATKAFVDECKVKPYAARYVGGMVSDIHRTILYGGIYLYPGSEKCKDGKLRPVQVQPYVIHYGAGGRDVDHRHGADPRPRPHAHPPALTNLLGLQARCPASHRPGQDYNQA